MVTAQALNGRATMPRKERSAENQAVGAYLGTYRRLLQQDARLRGEEKKWSQPGVTAQLAAMGHEFHANSVSDIEQYRRLPHSDNLMRLLDLYGLPANDVQALMANPEATREDGEELARRRWDMNRASAIDEVLASNTDAGLSSIVADISSNTELKALVKSLTEATRGDPSLIPYLNALIEAERRRRAGE